MSQPRNIMSWQLAKVKRLAVDELQEVTETAVAQDIIARIKKCLDRANHPNTPEAEAKAALRMSSRLMDQYNVRQADLVAEQANSEAPSTLDGQSVVAVSKQNLGGRVLLENWVSYVCDAILTFFDCKVYTTRRPASIDWTFYGIATNTAAAAMAFEMVHNLVQDWSSRRKGNKNSYRTGVAVGLREIANQEKMEEERRVSEQSAKELAAKEAEEERQRQAEIDRLSGNIAVTDDASYTSAGAPPMNSPQVKLEHEPETPIKDEPEESGSDRRQSIYGITKHDSETDDAGIESDTDTFPDFGSTSSEDGDENSGGWFPSTFAPLDTTFNEGDEPAIDITADFEDELRRHISKRERSNSPMPSPTVTVPQDLEDQTTKDKQPGTLWRDVGALVLFRENAQKIADDYLKKQNVKLSTRKRRPTSKIRDPEAYRAGKEDSKKIDVKRRRIEC